jgi:hypothetical protein
VATAGEHKRLSSTEGDAGDRTHQGEIAKPGFVVDGRGPGEQADAHPAGARADPRGGFSDLAARRRPLARSDHGTRDAAPDQRRKRIVHAPNHPTAGESRQPELA